MKTVRQFAVLVTVCFLGEIFARLIPLPVPATIYALILMLLALFLKIFPLEKVEPTASRLLEIMPMLFVPSTVGIIIAWPVLKKYWPAMLILGIGGTAVNFFVTGKITQLIIRVSAKKNARGGEAQK